MSRPLTEAQIDEITARLDTTRESLASMPHWTRAQLGIPTVIPQLDYGPVKRFFDSYIPRHVGLRKLFGLDQDALIDPPFQLGDDKVGVGSNSSSYNAQLQFERDRNSTYALAEEMDTYGILSSALDVVAEEATQTDRDTGRAVWITSENAQIREELMALLDRLGIEDKIFGICRAMCKYGDNFQQPVSDTTRGIISMRPIDPRRLTRVEDGYGRLVGFVPGIIRDSDVSLDSIKKDKKHSKPYQFLHFRLMGSRQDSVHGESYLMPARRSWRQLKILEDMMVLYRMNRAADKDVYYIDTGTQTPEQQWQTVHLFRRELRKHFMINPTTGFARQQYNPRTVDEDLYFPVPKDSKSRVERLSGSPGSGDIMDVEHFRDALFSALKIPKAWLGFEGDVNSKATLTEQSIRFARTIKRIQRALRHGLTWICKIHLALMGYDTEDKTNRFKLMMSSINTLDDAAAMELWRVKLEVGQLMLLTGLESHIPNYSMWMRYVMKEIFGLDRDDIDVMMEPDPNKVYVSEIPPAGPEATTSARPSPSPKSADTKKETLTPTQIMGNVDARLRVIKDYKAAIQDDGDFTVEKSALPPKLAKQIVDDKNPPGERFVELYDLAEEKKKLDEVLGLQATAHPECPACRKARVKFEESTKKAWCDKCGFVAEIDQTLEPLHESQ